MMAWILLVDCIHSEVDMLGIPRRYAHFVYGAIQSGLTCAIAAGIATSQPDTYVFFLHWLQSWLLSWLVMMPVVLLAAPAIRRLTHALTREETAVPVEVGQHPARGEKRWS